MEDKASAAAEDVIVDNANFKIALLLTTMSGLTTALGGVLVVSLPTVTNNLRSLGIWLGAAAGFMLSVTIIEIIPEVLLALSVFSALGWAIGGALAIYLLKVMVPEPDLTSFVVVKIGHEEDSQHLSKILWSGFLTALSLGIHNFPEGVAVSVASLNGLDFGIPLAMAVAFHNIPEGAAVASPIFFATRDKKKAILVSLLSGLAEPLGVIFVYGIGQSRLTPHVVACLLAVVGGVMIGLSLTELLPQSIKFTSPRTALSSLMGGGLIMTIILGFVNSLELTTKQED